MNKQIEIIKYKNLKAEINDEKIHDFVNKSMHEFIGRPLKQRQDVLDIKSYYIKNGGNFWIAIDRLNNKIIGTIALEKREDKGILKRFYVDENYQCMGIGSKLYNSFERYALEKNIKVIYLVCGQVLKKAHKFYEKMGYKQIDKLEIEMHIADDDDYFKKVLD